MAHQVNGDLAYGFGVGSALRTLAEWHSVLSVSPGAHRSTGGLFAGLEALAELLAVAVLRVVRLGVKRFYDLELSLLYPSEQRAEYFADLLSARVASTAAATSSLDRMFLASLSERAVSYAARRREVDVWAAERRFLDELPPKEWERQRRIQTKLGTSTDATHPPTNLRIALLQRETKSDATVAVSPDESKAIERELESAYRLAGEHLASRLRYPPTLLR